MGVFSTAGPARPRPARRSVRFTFTSMVAVPTVCMVLLWGLAAGIVLATSLSGHGAFSHDHRELVGIVLIVAAGLVVVIAALILTGSFARRLSQDRDVIQANNASQDNAKLVVMLLPVMLRD